MVKLKWEEEEKEAESWDSISYIPQFTRLIKEITVVVSCYKILDFLLSSINSNDEKLWEFMMSVFV